MYSIYLTCCGNQTMQQPYIIGNNSSYKSSTHADVRRVCRYHVHCTSQQCHLETWLYMNPNSPYTYNDADRAQHTLTENKGPTCIYSSLTELNIVKKNNSLPIPLSCGPNPINHFGTYETLFTPIWICCPFLDPCTNMNILAICGHILLLPAFTLVFLTLEGR